ncbi:MAG TPA: hypothetical protein VGM11_05440 [Acidobacteriaceae bacterium]|jgi:uncharacterized protein (DUF58 family)
MPVHSLRALVAAVMLVPLLWLGIVLVGKLHGSAALVPAMVAWAIVVLADLALTVWSLRRSRQHRVERRPEPTAGRR